MTHTTTTVECVAAGHAWRFTPSSVGGTLFAYAFDRDGVLVKVVCFDEAALTPTDDECADLIRVEECDPGSWLPFRTVPAETFDTFGMAADALGLVPA